MGTLVLQPVAHMDCQQHALPPPAFSITPSGFAAPVPLARPYAQAPPAFSFQQIQHPQQRPSQQPSPAQRGRMSQRPQQQSGQAQLGVRTSRGKKRKHRWHGKGRGEGGQASLAALSAQNRRRAQQHFGHGKAHGKAVWRPAQLPPQSRARWAEAFACVTTCADTPMSEAPRTAPHAPHNDNSFILSQHGRIGSGKCYDPHCSVAAPAPIVALLSCPWLLEQLIFLCSCSELFLFLSPQAAASNRRP